MSRPVFFPAAVILSKAKDLCISPGVDASDIALLDELATISGGDSFLQLHG
jgi:hypothetical protein